MKRIVPFAFCLIVAVFILASPEVRSASEVSHQLFQRNIRAGEQSSEVTKLQTVLNQIVEPAPQLQVDGRFEEKTLVALKQFQELYGLKPTGQMNLKTRRKLNEVVTRFTGQQEIFQASGGDASAAPPPPTPVSEIPVQKEKIIPSGKPYFEYHWKTSERLAGEVKLPTPAPTPVVVLDGEPVKSIANNAGVRLAKFYKIILVDEEEKWNDFTSSMFLDTLERFPKSPFDFYARGGVEPPTWTISLTKEKLINDVEILDGNRVRLSKAAFTRSNPILQPQAVGNVPRIFYSNRLFQAILLAFYTERTSFDYLGELLRVRYGVSLGMAEPADEFQAFEIEEIIFIASVLEDLPSGFHNMPGLEKIVRRRHGLVNPKFPDAAAIAFVDLGYMEFMDTAFESGSADYIQRIVAHEFTHFLWAKVLSAETRKQFMDLSGWSREPSKNAILATLIVATDHPKSRFMDKRIDPWYHDKTTNFVSDYAAAHNPDEDFAETLSYFVYSPDKVRTIAPEKYNFVKNILDGYEYVIFVDKQFTFQVFNLEPDLTFPGKIVGIDIRVYKLDSGDNRVVATLRLSQEFGDGAEQAYARIVSKTQTYRDEYFYPVEGNKFLLRADFEISKYAAAGYWIPEQITVMDKVDNRRYEPQTQFGWMLYLDNPLEDLEPPVVDVSKISYRVETGLDEDSQHQTKWVEITIPMEDKTPISLGAHGSIVHEPTGQNEGRYSTGGTSEYPVTLQFPIRSYRASGTWTFRQFTAFDIAGNEKVYDMKEKAILVEVKNKKQDLVKPTLDISGIRIEATPRYPEAPNGETDVSIWYRAKDDNSGLGLVAYTILKPNGDTIYDFHYHVNYSTAYFIGDPKKLTEYRIDLTLPPGSIPGTWILREMVLHDHAGNVLTSNFVEIGIVRPFKVF